MLSILFCSYWSVVINRDDTKLETESAYFRQYPAIRIRPIHELTERVVHLKLRKSVSGLLQ